MQKNSWNSKRFFTTAYSLIIRSDFINFDDVNDNLAFKDVSVIKKGDLVSRVFGKSEMDVYIYEKKILYKDEKSRELFSFLDELLERKDFLLKYSREYDVVVRIYMQVSDAQIYFEMQPQIIEKLNKLGLPIEVSILSWGEVYDIKEKLSKKLNEIFRLIFGR